MLFGYPGAPPNRDRETTAPARDPFLSGGATRIPTSLPHDNLAFSAFLPWQRRSDAILPWDDPAACFDQCLDSTTCSRANSRLWIQNTCAWGRGSHPQGPRAHHAPRIRHHSTRAESDGSIPASRWATATIPEPRGTGCSEGHIRWPARRGWCRQACAEHGKPCCKWRAAWWPEQKGSRHWAAEIRGKTSGRLGVESSRLLNSKPPPLGVGETGVARPLELGTTRQTRVASQRTYRRGRRSLWVAWGLCSRFPCSRACETSVEKTLWPTASRFGPSAAQTSWGICSAGPRWNSDCPQTANHPIATIWSLHRSSRRLVVGLAPITCAVWIESQTPDHCVPPLWYGFPLRRAPISIPKTARCTRRLRTRAPLPPTWSEQSPV